MTQTNTQRKLTSRQARFAARYGPWAVVTGASSGIGRDIALCAAERGVNVVLVARRKDLLQTLADHISATHGRQTRIIQADLATAEGFEAVAQQTSDLDVGLLVAAAGFGTSGPFLNADEATETEMLMVNCRALLANTLHFARRFTARRRGGIVLLASLVGYQGTPRAAHYAATKAYVQTLAEALHVELKPQGVDVLASAPGPVHSGFAERAGMKMGAAVTPADVAHETLDALGRKITVTPGLLSKILTYSLMPLPRWMRTRIMGQVMSGMTS
jgi:uncharacterized protein